MEKDALQKILEDDDLGLLNIKPKRAAITVDERLLASFQQINDFYRQHNKEPESNPTNILEFQLFNRLKGLRASKEKCEALQEVDEFGLLTYVEPTKPITSVADIFEDDSFGLLDDEAASIFDLKHVPKSPMDMPEKIAQRKRCNDFEQFEPLFKQCYAELAAGVRETRGFTGEQQIQPGHFFILHGITVYVAEVGEKEVKNGKVNARLRCIFENGTESNMLLRSLATELYKDETGRRILAPAEKALEALELIQAEDKKSGYLYVLASLSTTPEIANTKNLFKIGYSTVPVQERIKSAAEEPTYLMAPVKVISVFECYNLNPQKFELLLHSFFGKACLNVDVYDKQGKRFSPREWFIAPLHIIEAAANMLINGDIVNYRYDPQAQSIEER
ncbi:GIY-YIG nuclease family protein [Burkholderia cepacia]|uniref:GIY-YIG nuclease family protein n=1 Tax=Burkholderia cepacia TaxID=292 RepID=UPI0020188765|nr:GIY-YIG nuclease family protein [Burkholderia cepacia]UQO33008.1 GIY-YIG nuclease family protein [Burkholderia cepacia]UQO46503.1 GIY-YIG nuclease family protein [Burkholderia cepacia]UQP11583.1 GIY-YIG nuclease family protein [Burkholderia cepacia]